MRLNSEKLILLERVDNVRKDNGNEVINLASIIDEMHASMSEKIDTDATRTREAIREYVDDKFRAVS